MDILPPDHAIAHRRSIGQFFTPSALAGLMAAWVCEIRPGSILDPAVGRGILLQSAHRMAPHAALMGYDIDPACLAHAACAVPAATVARCDYLDIDDPRHYDAIVMNPPYIRHHLLQNHAGAAACRRWLAARDIQVSGLANAYLLFTLKALEHLNPGGRAAVLLPAEWANANFGRALKDYLRRHEMLDIVVYFDHATPVFDDNISTGCLLLITRGRTAERSVATLYVTKGAPIPTLADLEAAAPPAGIIRQAFAIETLAAATKWDHLLQHGERLLPSGMVPLKALARTRRGIVTGDHGYFHLTAERAARHGIDPDHLMPCIGKASDATGYVLTAADLAALDATGRPTQLLSLPSRTDWMTAAERAYLASGIAAGIDQKYLARHRSPWWGLERSTIAPILAGVFSRGMMRFVFNATAAANLTAFHGIYPSDMRPVAIRALATCLNSALVQTQARAILRVYGNGLLKCEPRDLLDIPVPDLRQVSDATLAQLSGALDRLDQAARLDRKHAALPDIESLVADAATESSINT